MARTPTHVRGKPSPIRRHLTHPIVDADSHTIEIVPAFLDFLGQVGGAAMVERFNTLPSPMTSIAEAPWYRMSWAERRDGWVLRPGWWRQPTKNTLDRATASLPRLFRERMDEIGLDFSIVYPSLGFQLPAIRDPELRVAACRAVNMLHADLFREHADRLRPVAMILAETPQQALDELDFAVKKLGLRAITIAGPIRRPIPGIVRAHPAAASEAWRLETFGIDSEYDYDPLWARCVELKLPVTFHQAAVGIGSRRSISNHMNNHIGHFGAAGEAICKSLFLAGVTRRFPQLTFAFQEGGVAWACALFADLIEHWEKRNRDTIQNYNPNALDVELYEQLLLEYGSPLVQRKVKERAPQLFAHDPADQPITDEWAVCRIDREEDFKELFVQPFYFGCETGDRLAAWAFNEKINPMGSRLKAIIGSDISHWDVVDMSQLLSEVYHHVEEGLLTERDFRDFTFVNPVTLYTDMDPDFFVGTAVESSVKELLVQQAAQRR